MSYDENDPIRTGELTEKVWHMFGTGYTKLTQVRAATGYADLNTADMMVMGEWPSTGNELHGFEVKVSRADWLNEVKNPHKNDSVKSYCDRWWLVIADEAMVKPGELPDDWGMMAFVGRGRKLKVVKKAPLLDSQPLDKMFVASLLRHNDKEAIPVDIHRDKLNDVRREATALEKKRCAALFSFVRELSKGYGFDIREVKETEWIDGGAQKVFSHWSAEIKDTYLGRMSAERLADMLRRISAYDDMRSEVDIIERRLQEMVNRAGELTNTYYVVPWAEWALKSIRNFKGEAGDAK